MASEIVVAAIGAAGGLVSGTGVSLIAPWANWAVKKREADRNYRREQIAEWRAGIAAMTLASHVTDEPWYFTLRRYIERFDRPLLNVLEPLPRTTVVPAQSPGLRLWVERLSTVVDRVEDDWNLSARKHRK
ncbi:hypothetical protein [Nocardia brasiliensis]|uniref:hypothetical protein n=1 Tax=Nocardia brasiliensis TaxID=37326 RepID=UPI00245784F7|nr:hypothetical protein [Nocardia brasiliensis]